MPRMKLQNLNFTFEVCPIQKVLLRESPLLVGHSLAT